MTKATFVAFLGMAYVFLYSSTCALHISYMYIRDWPDEGSRKWTDFSVGPVVTGQGVMVLNYKRLDIQETRYKEEIFHNEGDGT